VNVCFYRGLSGKDLWRPTCHDYIERKEISMPHIQKKDLEESGSHQNEEEHDWTPSQGGQGRRLPSPCPIKREATDHGLN